MPGSWKYSNFEKPYIIQKAKKQLLSALKGKEKIIIQDFLAFKISSAKTKWEWWKGV